MVYDVNGNVLVQIDDTLTVANAAADAKVVGDKVGELESVIDDTTSPGKNLFDKDHINALNAYIFVTSGETSGTLKSSSGARTVYVKCEPNTTYTVSKQFATARFVVGYSVSEPAIQGTVYNAKTYHGSTSITITTGENASYLVAFVYLSTADTYTYEQICAMLQIEKGDTATPYEPYALTAKDTIARDSAEDNAQRLNDMGSQIVVTSERPSAEFGDEMIQDFSALTPIGGSTYSDGVWSIPLLGGVSTTLSVVRNTRYFIQLTVSSAPVVDGSSNYRVNPLVITLGNDSISIYSDFDANFKVCLRPTVTEQATLSLQCQDALTLELTSLSVKPVVSLPVSPLELNSVPFFSADTNNGKSVAFGGGQFKRISSSPNTAFGFKAEQDLDTGIENTGIGFQAQTLIRNGRANTAVGNCAQQRITTGMYNNAIGTVAQGGLAGHEFTGCWNNALGNEAQRDITSGCNNVGVGRRAQSYITEGNMNVAVGAFAGFATKNHQGGDWGTKKSSFQTLVGGESTQAVADGETGNADYLTTLGYRTIGYEKAIAIGANAEAKGVEAIAIGYDVKVSTDKEIAIGTAQHSIILCGKRITFNQDGTVTWVAV